MEVVRQKITELDDLQQRLLMFDVVPAVKKVDLQELIRLFTPTSHGEFGTSSNCPTLPNKSFSCPLVFLLLPFHHLSPTPSMERAPPQDAPHAPETPHAPEAAHEPPRPTRRHELPDEPEPAAEESLGSEPPTWPLGAKEEGGSGDGVSMEEAGRRVGRQEKERRKCSFLGRLGEVHGT